VLTNIQGPRLALVGPWAHKYPHFAKPGPQIGFLQECLRWWNKWLKGIENGVMHEPMLRAWMEDPIRPAAYNPEKPGHWVAETQWPPARQKFKKLGLSCGRLGKARDDVLSISSPQTTGRAGGKWCAYGSWEDQPLDQREEMGGQLVFDTDPLTDDLIVLGAPVLTTGISCDRPNGILAATLCEVFPDGAATRVSYGLLNLTHRDGHETPQPLVPGNTYRVTVKLNDIGHLFGAGNRIRLAISNAYWPIAWPSPQANILSIHCRNSALSLPLRSPNKHDALLTVVAEPQSAKPLSQTEIEPASNSWTAIFNAMTGEATLSRANTDGWRRINGINLELGVQSEHKYTIKAGDPLSARLDTHYLRRYRRGNWAVAIETKITVISTLEDFLVEASLEAREGYDVVKTRNWSLRVPRDHV
jgi:predicted acyl esterase